MTEQSPIFTLFTYVYYIQGSAEPYKVNIKFSYNETSLFVGCVLKRWNTCTLAGCLPVVVYLMIETEHIGKKHFVQL